MVNLSHFLAVLQHDIVLQWLVVIVPVLIVLDLLTAVAVALRDKVFTFLRIADFMGNDLARYAALLFTPLGAIFMGVDTSIAVGVEKGMILALIVSITTSIALHLQSLTNLPIAFWENLISGELAHVGVLSTESDTTPPGSTTPVAPSLPGNPTAG